MSRKDGRGFYVTLSGGEHAGKTSHVLGLEDFFIDKGLDCKIIREPGGTQIGAQIRRILLDPVNIKMDPMAEVFLYIADRAQQFGEYNVPTLNSGISIVSDRCFLETIAYQGYGRGMDVEMIKRLNRIAMGAYMPNISFIIDGDPKEMTANSDRKVEDFDRLDRESIDFHRRVRAGFLKLADQYSFCRIVPYIPSGQDVMQDMMKNILSEELGL